ncbi:MULTISPECIES: hypothetical protein [Streptomyces]|uniref:Zinc ribbon domain-containing protein n=1 Tax=Streptomyces drozdowiczii TaxID=202862 RepID=A0ABY6PKR0_9ACTN|nr:MULTISPECIES: hypothetical protein [Streptomyces]MCX0247842.1 hypothetical protein [Streptomyces drozdowiczii]UZK52800.1 hypothetical protein NEH16_00565 [Streptomyces drozdowiczii]
MTSEEGQRAQRFCKACGTPAGDEKLCEKCGAVLGMPDAVGLVDDEAAVARRVFEERNR